MISALVIFALVSSLVKAGDPKLKTPVNTTVWHVNQLQTVAWDPNFRTLDGSYYNAFTTINIQLFQTRLILPDLLIATLIENLPFTQGYYQWTVPETYNDTTVLGFSQQFPIGNDNKSIYKVKVYPSFFDWPNGCDGCKAKAPMSDLFSIKTKNAPAVPVDDSGFLVAPNPPNSTFLPPINQAPSPFLIMRYVGISLGGLALLSALVLIVIYTLRKHVQKRRLSHGKMTMANAYGSNSPSSMYRPDFPPSVITVGPSRLSSSHYCVSPTSDKYSNENYSHDNMSNSPMNSLNSSAIPHSANRTASTIPTHLFLPMLEIPSYASSHYVNQPPHQTNSNFNNAHSSFASPFDHAEGSGNNGDRYSGGGVNGLKREPSSKSLIPFPVSEAILVGSHFRNVLRMEPDALKASEPSVDIPNRLTNHNAVSDGSVGAFGTSSPMLSRLQFVDESLDKS